MSANLPLIWADKKNSPLLADFIAKYGAEYCMTAEEINQLRNAVNEMAVIQQSTFLGAAEPAFTPAGTGTAYWLAIKPGTYANYGGFVVAANEIAFIIRDAAGAFSITKSSLVIPDSKIKTWIAQSYSSGDQVNYQGKDWTANSATVSGDVPATSTKWDDRLSGYISGEPLFDIAKTVNLFNKATVSAGVYSDTYTNFTPSTVEGTSDFMAVTPNTAYKRVGTPEYYIYYFDTNKQFLSSVLYANIVTTPANAYFVKIHYRTGDINGIMFTLSSVNTSSYIPFTLPSIKVKNVFLNTAEIIVSPVVYLNDPLEQKMTALESQTTNGSGLGWLLERNQFKGQFNFFSAWILCSTIGETVTMKIYKTTDGIAQWNPTSSNTALIATKEFTNFNANSGIQFECFFDNVIEYPDDKDLYIYFENVNKKLRMFRNENSYTGVASTLLELRNPQTNYFLDATGYTTQLPILALVNKMEYQTNKKLTVDLSNKIVIPDVIYAVVGKELNIYKNSILDIPNQIDSFEIILTNITLGWTSNSDSSGITINDRSLKFKPTTAGQSHIIRCNVLDYKRQVVGTKDFQIKTVSKTAGTGTKNIVMAGDSLTEGGTGESALKLYNAIISDGGFTPVMVGTKVNGFNSAVKHEGYSGQTFGFFTGSISPFYVGGQINYQAYATAKGVASIDIFHIQCGINDVLSGIFFNGATLIPDIITNLTSIVDKVLSADKGFPNCKIIIGLEPYGANGENFVSSRNTNELKRKMMLLNNAISAKFYQDETGFKYHANVWVAPNSLTIDRDYGYPYSMVKVCEFADVSQTEKQFADTVHPNGYGNEQIANSVYSMIRRVLQ
ncbi:SGNH/GDSL hydrolase family protein [Flavobacterium sp. GT2N3]|uniref:SGNH/GDSL hydrolase family protein n=1 Tax=unclassified Flavobacterium TaxID=196869 RepID=UPI003AACCDFD